MASGSRLEADHRHLSLNSRARSLGIEERDEGRGGGGYAPRHGTRSLRSRDRVHRAVDRSYEAARWNRGGSRRYRFAIHSLLASYDNEPCKDPRCHVCASPASSKGRGTRHGTSCAVGGWRRWCTDRSPGGYRLSRPRPAYLYSQAYGCISTIRLRATCVLEYFLPTLVLLTTTPRCRVVY